MSIYHLHIPRTSGVYIRENLIKSFKDDNNFVGHKEKMPESFKKFDKVSGHFANNPVKDCEFTFAVTRNPVSLTFSYIQYMRDRFYPTLTFDELFSKYEKEDKLKSFTNINTKFLTGFINLNKYNKSINDLKRLAENCWEVENFSGTIEFTKIHLNESKIHLLKYEDPNLYRHISDIYNKKIQTGLLNESSKVDDRVLKKYSRVVLDLNWLDLELYEFIK